MAKKTPVKKSKRRLKRSVRRSLAAVLMITAIGVAAIPVPENYAAPDAADGGIMTRAADKHADEIAGKTSGGGSIPAFKFEPYEIVEVTNEETGQKDKVTKGTKDNDEKRLPASFTLSAFADADDQTLADQLNQNSGTDGKYDSTKPDLHTSLAITNTGNESNPDYTLAWQFLYYEQTVNNNYVGVICKYNSLFMTPTIELSLYPTTEYFVMAESDVTNYFDSTKWSNGKNTNVKVKLVDNDDPTADMKLTYDSWDLGVVDPVFSQGFPEDYAQWEASCLAFKNQGQGGTLTKPNNFVVKPVNMDASYQLEYLASRCKDLQTAGEGFTLKLVHDGRFLKAGSIYLAQGGTLKENGPAYRDDYGFVILAKTEIPIMGIGDGTFRNVNNVENMVLPDQLAYIGDEAFMNAQMLTSINLQNVSSIGNRAFKSCTSLEKAEFGTTLSVVGQEGFGKARNLRAVSFGKATSIIGYGAFANCNNLQTVAFADDGNDCEVKAYAFYNCTALSDVSMERASIIQFGDGVFAVEGGASPMHFVLPRDLGREITNCIGNFLFAGRSGLEYVVFPQQYGYSKTATIPNSVFHGCANLQYVEFPCDEKEAPNACGFAQYNPELLFADVISRDFYVKGPKMNSSNSPAYPRTSTWEAETAVSDKVPYLYIENGVEYYEVSDGFYLLCINNEGVLTSCTVVPSKVSELDEWEKKGAEVEIPSVVGNTKVTAIASNCFSDSQLNEKVKSLVISDNSISAIADGAFQAGGGDNKKDWLNLGKVYIGNSVTSIGNNAFKDCNNLTDVTFASPKNGHNSFTIGTDAFTTQSPELTFHGDIVVGYAPFEWATDPDNVIQEKDYIRVCYKSLAPTYLTVMYNPVTGLVTLLDYPKYDEVSKILDEQYKEEIGDAGSYQAWREAALYRQYSTNEYDSQRKEFVRRWRTAGQDENLKQAVYKDDTVFGPWIGPDFIVFLQSDAGQNTEKVDHWLNGDMGYEDWRNAGGWASARENISPVDWLFDPIIAYAAEDIPDPYYTVYPYDVLKIVDANDPYRQPSYEEQSLVYYTQNIEIPAGVESIDVFGYVNNLTQDGTKAEDAGILQRNTGNYNTYLFESWDSKSADMYRRTSGTGWKDDDTDVVPGLFSGYYDDFTETTDREKHERGNDLIRSVKMSTVEYLPDYAFDSCENLNSVDIGICSDIGTAPFRGCYSMQTVTDNDYYTTVNGIIYSKNSDGTLTIEECLAARGNLVGQAVINLLSDSNLTSVSAIKPGAFEDCDYVTEVNFGSSDTAGLKVIPENCFKNADRLQTVVLPMSTNDVGRNAFVGVPNLSRLTVYGKEVKISGSAFDLRDKDDPWITVRAYEDSAVVRYVDEYGKQYHLQYDETNPLGEVWQVSFYDANYQLIEDLKDRDGNDLDNPQYVDDGARATEPQTPANTTDWTFERWVGMNNVKYGDPIHEDTAFYAQGYTTSGMVGGKYPVTFWDSIDGTQVGPTQYVDPGNEAIAPAHPVHEGYDPDGYSDTFTNVQSPKTILMKYKANGAAGSGGSTGTTSGQTTSNKPGGGTTGNTSNTSSTSSSGSTSTTTTSSSDGSTQTMGLYVVTVIGGSGSGTYAAGTTVQITANTPAAGSVFSRWVTESQGVSLASVSTTPTTFTMPANNVTITAEYTVATATPTSTNGTGSTGNTGNTGNGSTRVDITKPGISNKDLATANVNGSTDNFVVKITETDEATRAVADALRNKYGSLDNILYYAMDISLYDSTGTVKITDMSGLSVDITIPIPDALVAYGGNNMAGAVINGNQLESLNENFTIINGVPCIRFTATHFSPYTIYVDTGNLTEGMLDVTPKTGDPIHPKWFLSLGLACLSVILFMKKDKAVKVKTA